MSTRFTMDVLVSHPLKTLLRWAHKGEAFFFEFAPVSGEEPSDILMFDTTEGKVISELLTDYAQLRLEEIGFHPDGSPTKSGGLYTADGGYGGYGDNVHGGYFDASGGSAPQGYGGGQDVTWGHNDGLPEGWHVMYDEASGANYYQNAVTGETTWEAPTA